MKKQVLCILMAIVCLFISSCDKIASSSTPFEGSEDINNNFRLIVNGDDVPHNNSVSINYEKQYANLPLIAILKALGGKVNWINEEKVTILFNDTSYILNPMKKTLKKEGEAFNIIAVPPGTGHGGYYQLSDQEFIIDSDSLRYFINLLDAKITVDYNNSVVKIETQNLSDKYITINNKIFSVEEIKNGIKNTLNSVLYYYGNDDTSDYLTSNKNIILKKDLKYELYFKPNSNNKADAFIFPPKIYFAITNIQHPLSSPDNILLYEFGIDVTEWGLRSEFSYQGNTTKGKPYSFIGDDTIYLGSHTMRIDEIKKPEHEEMDDEWKKKAHKAIQLYMDKNDFYADKDDNLEPGKYHVYIQKFSKSDKDSTIIFKNQNGIIYVGYYYFVHDISDDNAADLNGVELVETANEKAFQIYLERVCSNPALEMEYTLTQK